MTIGEASRLVKSIKFLHFSFEVRPMSADDVWLIISYKAPDTRDRDQQITLNSHEMMPNLHSWETKEFILFVYDTVQKCLKHEASELFFVDGLDVFNEHEIGRKKMKIIEAMFPHSRDHMSHGYFMASSEDREKIWRMKGEMQEREEKYLGYGN